MITPEQLHNWYLEAIRQLPLESYNKKANVPYKELTLEQKSIDEYICNKINEIIDNLSGEFVELGEYL